MQLLYNGELGDFGRLWGAAAHRFLTGQQEVVGGLPHGGEDDHGRLVGEAEDEVGHLPHPLGGRQRRAAELHDDGEPRRGLLPVPRHRGFLILLQNSRPRLAPDHQTPPPPALPSRPSTCADKQLLPPELGGGAEGERGRRLPRDAREPQRHRHIRTRRAARDPEAS
uniref:Uncharacterized protein n=1 Tax=Arundo donax TaxID=35708 RepID=A0A0A9EXR7_ARUDO